MLNNEAQRQKLLKSRVQSKAAQTRRTRHSLVRNSEEAEIITTDNKQTNSEDIKSNTPADQQCSETFIMELDNTLLDADDTLSSTISTWFKRIYFDSFTTCITYYNMQIFRIRTKAYCLFSSSPSIYKFTCVMAEKYNRTTEVYNKHTHTHTHTHTQTNKHARVLTYW